MTTVSSLYVSVKVFNTGNVTGNGVSLKLADGAYAHVSSTSLLGVAAKRRKTKISGFTMFARR